MLSVILQTFFYLFSKKQRIVSTQSFVKDSFCKVLAKIRLIYYYISV